jgi:hypothetical protein
MVSEMAIKTYTRECRDKCVLLHSFDKDAFQLNADTACQKQQQDLKDKVIDMYKRDY